MFFDEFFRLSDATADVNQGMILSAVSKKAVVKPTDENPTCKPSFSIRGILAFPYIQTSNKKEMDDLLV